VNELTQQPMALLVVAGKLLLLLLQLGVVPECCRWPSHSLRCMCPPGVQEESADREKKLTLRAEQLGTRLHSVLEELADARQLAAERLDPGEVAELRVRLGHAEMDAGTLRLHEQELEAQVQRMGAMTPRPAWGELQPFGPEEPVRGQGQQGRPLVSHQLSGGVHGATAAVFTSGAWHPRGHPAPCRAQQRWWSSCAIAQCCAMWRCGDCVPRCLNSDRGFPLPCIHMRTRKAPRT
jgi:hypothetical protein